MREIKTCSLLAVGDELLDGRVEENNSTFIGEKLRSLGVEVVLRAVVGDDARSIKSALKNALAVSDLLVVTGGLGPTDDDLTREAVAEALGLALRRDPSIEERLRGFFRAMGREMSPSNLKQADLVEGAEVLEARLGTAPGQWIEHAGKVVVLLPGVPHEMRDMVENELVGRVSARAPGERGGSVSLLVAARPESELGEEVKEALSGIEGVGASFRVADGRIEVKLTSREDLSLLAEAERRVRERLGGWVLAQGEETLEGNLGRELRARGLTLAVAESLTGGMLGERITSVPGSSDYFRGGIIAYDYRAKEELLGVDPDLLRSRGAVNEEVVAAMARGARERLGTDLGVAVSGVAGPGQGVESEPPGTVAFGLCDGEREFTWKYRLPGDRERVRRFAVTVALTVVLLYVRDGDVGHVR
ncbi:MAG: CinA family nicotinamide mononucleotide deamidase-related protein [Actinomycetota bacterium]|nr:CinA family nicotinamide mononucleotide deamidase-related protein [Actinomycetota bacterium]